MQSVKHWHPGSRTCLITDQPISDPAFDHVKILPVVNRDNPYANDSQVFQLTPFRETIKLEADMLMVSDCAHWWNILRHRDVVVSTGCRNWRDENSDCRHYRKIFDENHLPDVYNAVTYWRLSETARDFFRCVKDIFERWPEYRKLLRYPDDVPSTDLVYAMAAVIVGPERVTMPFASYPKITHMKKHIAGTDTDHWPHELVWEWNGQNLRVNTIAQWGAFHYHIKSWKP